LSGGGPARYADVDPTTNTPVGMWSFAGSNGLSVMVMWSGETARFVTTSRPPRR
jgi:hypothetical protein